VGVEVEWLTIPADGSPPPDVRTLRDLLSAHEPLPSGCRITFEPGGQIELSTPVCATAADACDAVASDAAVVRGALDDHAIRLVGLGLDPTRPELLRTDEARYVAMKAYLDQDGPSGRRMMCSTAAIHVNVGLGPDATRRWRLAHRLGPTLVAAFANSPLVAGGPSGWRSARFASWLGIDPTRTAPVANGSEPSEEWADYALAARVMLIRADTRFVPPAAPLSLRRWIEDGHELGHPTLDDVDYHLTTLFPPVRPRGWFELRMVDMLPDPLWRVAVAVTTALLDDEDAARRAWAASEPAAAMWTEAARSGLAHPALAASARTCFAAAVDALADEPLREAASAYADRYVNRGRTPADDRLDAWTRYGSLLPIDESLEAI
jgi:glutamate--cysteine ligase